MGGRGPTAQCLVCKNWVKRPGMRDHMRGAHGMKDVVFAGGAHLPSYPTNYVDSYREVETNVKHGRTEFLDREEILRMHDDNDMPGGFP